MADSFTANLNLRKPEVGHADDTWGGISGLNGDLDLIDAIFAASGSGTSVGLNIGSGKTLNVSGAINWVRVPPGTDQLVSVGAAQTLTGKSLISPVINGGTLTSVSLVQSTANTQAPFNGGGALATCAYVDQAVAAGGGGGGEPGPTPGPSYVGAGHAAYIGSNIPLNSVGSYFNGPSLPAAGNAGEVWKIEGGAYFTSTGNDFFGAHLFNGSGIMGPEGIVGCPANYNTFCSVCAVVVLSGPTAWVLRARDFNSGGGQLTASSWLAATKVA